MPTPWKNYGNVEYWDDRYTQDTQPFEWYQTYSTIRQFMTPRELSPQNSATRLRDKENEQSYYNQLTSTRTAIPTSPSATYTDFPPKHKCKVLIIGCGSSRFGQDMMKDGWIGGIVNVDYSKVVIEQMKKSHDEAFYRRIEAKINREQRANAAATATADDRNDFSSQKANADVPSVASTNMQTPTKSRGGGHAAPGKNASKQRQRNKLPMMEFHCVDITEALPYPDASFDLIIAKGTLDAILCSNGSVSNTKKMMRSCSRVLKSHGSLIVVSHGKSDDRLLYFENDEKWWSGGVKVYKVLKPNVGALVAATGDKHHYVYVASK